MESNLPANSFAPSATKALNEGLPKKPPRPAINLVEWIRDRPNSNSSWKKNDEGSQPDRNVNPRKKNAMGEGQDRIGNAASNKKNKRKNQQEKMGGVGWQPRQTPDSKRLSKNSQIGQATKIKKPPLGEKCHHHRHRFDQTNCRGKKAPEEMDLLTAPKEKGQPEKAGGPKRNNEKMPCSAGKGRKVMQVQWKQTIWKSR